MIKKVAALGMVLVLAISLVACGGTSKEKGSNASATQPAGSSTKTTLAKCKESKSVTIGFANEVPYAYKDEKGELKGEAVDIARAVLAEEGITEIKGELVEFSALISGLQAGRYDMIAAGMAVTPERAKEVLFATPEISYGEALLVKKGNPKGLKSYGDIAKDSSITVGVPSGVIELEYLKGSGVQDGQVKITNDLSSAIKSLKTGRIDCVNASNTSLTSALKDTGSDDLELVGDFKQEVINGKNTIMYGASAFRTEDTDFQEMYSKGVEKLEKSGKLKEILIANGFNEFNLPNGMTVDKLIK